MMLAFIGKVIFATSGNRLKIASLCVKCGTLFMDDFHPFSGVIVAIKLCYPFLLPLLVGTMLDSLE